MKSKKIFFLISTLIFIISLFEIGFCKSRWVKVGDNWKYELREGSGNYVMERWREITEDGVNFKVYYFDYKGNMVTGPNVIRDELYVYADTGEAITTGYDIDGLHFETDRKGKVLGLPKSFDLSGYPHAELISTVTINTDQKTVYDDNNSISPTAAANQ